MERRRSAESVLQNVLKRQASRVGRDREVTDRAQGAGARLVDPGGRSDRRGALDDADS